MFPQTTLDHTGLGFRFAVLPFRLLFLPHLPDEGTDSIVFELGTSDTTHGYMDRHHTVKELNIYGLVVLIHLGDPVPVEELSAEIEGCPLDRPHSVSQEGNQ